MINNIKCMTNNNDNYMDYVTVINYFKVKHVNV